LTGEERTLVSAVENEDRRGQVRGATSRGPLAFPEIDQFAAEIDDFALCIGGSRIQVSGVEGLRDLRVVQALYESIRTGRAIALG
jgi:predicted dehydrogenase